MKKFATFIVRSRKDVEDLTKLMESRGYRLDSVKGKEEFIYDPLSAYPKDRHEEWTLSFSTAG